MARYRRGGKRSFKRSKRSFKKSFRRHRSKRLGTYTVARGGIRM